MLVQPISNGKPVGEPIVIYQRANHTEDTESGTEPQLLNASGNQVQPKPEYVALSQPLQEEQRPPVTPSPANENSEETKLGEAPEEQPRTTTPNFLRQQSVLLDPGEYEFSFSLQYQLDHSDGTIVALNNGFLNIGEAQRKQRLLIAPLELRVGLTPVMQAFINLPVGWSNGELSFAGTDEFKNQGGIGDLSAGITRHLIGRR